MDKNFKLLRGDLKGFNGDVDTYCSGNLTISLTFYSEQLPPHGYDGLIEVKLVDGTFIIRSQSTFMKNRGRNVYARVCRQLIQNYENIISEDDDVGGTEFFTQLTINTFMEMNQFFGDNPDFNYPF